MTAENSMEIQLSRYVELLERRRKEPDPFHILNVTRTESPYTHFLGWVLNPSAAHPWTNEFLIGLLHSCGQPLPPEGTNSIVFHIESFRYRKETDDEIGFTDPDIVAFAPDAQNPRWCLVIENKFDSKEGRAAGNATQCAMYEERSRKRFGEIEYAFLFTTRTGERARGETCFAPVSYVEIARVFGEVRQNLHAAGKWEAAGCTVADQYAYYLLDAFLRHLDFIAPKEDVRNAVRALSRQEKPAGISNEWIKHHKSAVDHAIDLPVIMEQWDYDSMQEEMIAAGATDAEMQAFAAIYEWGESRGDCQFDKPKKPSVTIKIPSMTGREVQILCIQSRKLRFYWVHFVGSKECGNVAGNHVPGKFPGAYDLVQRYCWRLNDTFGWNLTVNSETGGFREPSVMLEEIAEPHRLAAFLAILTDVADRALGLAEPLPPNTLPK